MQMNAKPKKAASQVQQRADAQVSQSSLEPILPVPHRSST